MKIRKSFVSNSSSCSFFIWLKTDKDVDHFNKIKDELITKFGKCCFNVCHSPEYIYDTDTLDNKIVENNAIKVYTGEDNEGNIRMEQLDNIYDYLFEKYSEFRIYRDPEAHYSYGNEFINEIKEND